MGLPVLNRKIPGNGVVDQRFELVALGFVWADAGEGAVDLDGIGAIILTLREPRQERDRFF